MYLVGLTGGIGSGKSTVARRFVELGAELIDADQIAREVVEPGQPALDDLVAFFGQNILQADGTLDRQRLAAIAFATDESRAALDRLTHPHIARRMTQRIAELAATAPRDARGTPPVVVVDHPLLIETGQADRFDAVVVVLAPAAERVRRVVEHRGLDEQDAWRRVQAQATDAERRAVATHQIVNDADQAALVGAATRTYGALRDAAHSASEDDR